MQQLPNMFRKTLTWEFNFPAIKIHICMWLLNILQDEKSEHQTFLPCPVGNTPTKKAQWHCVTYRKSPVFTLCIFYLFISDSICWSFKPFYFILDYLHIAFIISICPVSFYLFSSYYDFPKNSYSTIQHSFVFF
jgi:hypothetical protein